METCASCLRVDSPRGLGLALLLLGVGKKENRRARLSYHGHDSLLLVEYMALHSLFVNFDKRIQEPDVLKQRDFYIFTVEHVHPESVAIPERTAPVCVSQNSGYYPRAYTTS